MSKDTTVVPLARFECFVQTVREIDQSAYAFLEGGPESGLPFRFAAAATHPGAINVGPTESRGTCVVLDSAEYQ